MSAAANLKELQEEGENVQVDSLEVVIQSDAARANAELDKMIAKLTAVSNTIRSTSHLSIGGSSGTRGLTSTLSSLTNASNKAKKSTLSLASAFGKFYASCFLIIRGIKSLGKAINSSMDYIETYNYFNVITDKIGAEFSSAWKENGYSSAEEYADSFRQRLTDLTGKMSGFSIDENGVLSMTDSVGLGLDPEKLMNYQASIASVTNAVGLCGETSVNTSKALSMLAADMSSLKNVDLETVMTNLQSGLIGQSRALYKYGIDITNNTLQQYALANGIDKAVSEMTQAEKMQLRLLAILDQSKVAYGDMANTISSVANQYRMMKQQLSNLARIIGNLFIPMLQKVLPVINGIIIAMQRLFTWIGNIFGVDWSGLMDGISSGYTDTGLDEIADSADDVSDSYNAATESAKKFNKQLLSYHELNNLSSSDKDDDSSGSDEIDLSGAISDALGEYQNIWDKAFANMENEAEKWADKITDFFKKIKDTWVNDDADYTWLGEDLGEKINEWLNSIDWEAIKDNARKLGKAIATFLNGAIAETDWNLVGKTIAEGLNTALNFVWGFVTNFDFEKAGLAIADAINGFFQNFDFKKLGETVNTLIQGLWKLFTTAIANISWKDVWKGITDFFGEIDGGTLGIVFSAITFKLLGSVLTSGIIKELLLKKILGSFGSTAAGTAATVGTSGTGAIVSAALPVVAVITAISAALIDLWNTSDMFKGAVVGAFENIRDSLSSAFEKIGENQLWDSIKELGSSLYDLYEASLKPIVELLASLSVSSLGKMVSAGIDLIGGALSGLLGTITGAINIISGLADVLTGLLTLDTDKIAVGFTKISDGAETLSNGLVRFLTAGLSDKITETFSKMGKTISDWWKNDVDPLFTKERWSALGDTIKNAFGAIGTNISQQLDGVQNSLGLLWEDLYNKFSWEALFMDVSHWWNNTAMPKFKEVSASLQTWWDSMKEKYSWSALFENICSWWEKDVVPWFSENKWNFDGIAKGLSKAFNNAVSSVKQIWNTFAKYLNNMLKFSIPPIEILGFTIFSGATIELGKLPTFQTGGFPEDGLFMANHSELVGKFSNGKTAVANNDQIVSGISDGVSSANDKVVSAVLAIGDAIVDAINSGSSVSVNGAQILDVVRNEASSFRKQYGYAPL